MLNLILCQSQYGSLHPPPPPHPTPPPPHPHHTSIHTPHTTDHPGLNRLAKCIVLSCPLTCSHHGYHARAFFIHQESFLLIKCTAKERWCHWYNIIYIDCTWSKQINPNDPQTPQEKSNTCWMTDSWKTQNLRQWQVIMAVLQGLMDSPYICLVFSVFFFLILSIVSYLYRSPFEPFPFSTLFFACLFVLFLLLWGRSQNLCQGRAPTCDVHALISQSQGCPK